MFIHVVFDNGAEPYLFKGSERMVNDELSVLKTQWKLELLSIVNSGVFVKAFNPEEDHNGRENSQSE